MVLSRGLVKFVIGCWTHPKTTSVYTKKKNVRVTMEFDVIVEIGYKCTLKLSKIKCSRTWQLLNTQISMWAKPYLNLAILGGMWCKHYWGYSILIIYLGLCLFIFLVPLSGNILLKANLKERVGLYLNGSKLIFKHKPLKNILLFRGQTVLLYIHVPLQNSGGWVGQGFNIAYLSYISIAIVSSWHESLNK